MAPNSASCSSFLMVMMITMAAFSTSAVAVRPPTGPPPLQCCPCVPTGGALDWLLAFLPTNYTCCPCRPLLPAFDDPPTFNQLSAPVTINNKINVTNDETVVINITNVWSSNVTSLPPTPSQSPSPSPSPSLSPSPSPSPSLSPSPAEAPSPDLAPAPAPFPLDHDSVTGGAFGLKTGSGAVVVVALASFLFLY